MNSIPRPARGVFVFLGFLCLCGCASPTQAPSPSSPAEIAGTEAAANRPEAQLPAGILATPALLDATETPSLEPTASPSPAPTLEPTLQSLLCRPIQLPTPGPHEVIAPMLIYHHVGYTGVDSGVESSTKYNVSTANFAAQLDLLEQLGYTPVGASRIASAMQGKSVLPARPIAITFDDGWEDQYANAFPLLQERGMTATFYIPSTYPGAPDTISWEQLQQIVKGGMEIGSHSRTHPHLKGLDGEQLWQEIRISKVELEKKLGVPVNTYAYPFGEMNPSLNLAQLVSTAGYWAAVGVNAGYYQDQIFDLKRDYILRNKDLSGFTADLPWRGEGTAFCGRE